MVKTLPPALVQYTSISKYVPEYGDYIIWSGMLTTWHGIIVEYDIEKNQIVIIFEGTPYLLFTSDDKKMNKNSYRMDLSKIKGSVRGKFSIMKHVKEQNAVVWYV